MWHKDILLPKCELKDNRFCVSPCIISLKRICTSMLYKLSLINSILAVCVQETYSSLNLTGNLCFYSLQMVCRKKHFFPPTIFFPMDWLLFRIGWQQLDNFVSLTSQDWMRQQILCQSVYYFLKRNFEHKFFYCMCNFDVIGDSGMWSMLSNTTSKYDSGVSRRKHVQFHVIKWQDCSSDEHLPN